MAKRLFSLTGGITRRHFQTEAVRRTNFQNRSPKPREDRRTTPSGEQADEPVNHPICHHEDQEQVIDNGDPIAFVDDSDEDPEDSDSFQGFSSMYDGFTRMPETIAYKQRLKKLYKKKVK